MAAEAVAAARVPPATVASAFASSSSASPPPPLLPPLIHPPSTASLPAAAAAAAASPPPPAQPAQPALSFPPHYVPPAAPVHLQPQSAPAANGAAVAPASVAAQPQPAPVGDGGGGATAALLAQYNVARRLLHAWPDTVHQFERESGVCFDLQHFAALLRSADYSAASDYLVSFWIHPLYRTTLSRAEHCQVRHSLVNAMKLKLTLLCMTSDRLSLDYFVEKELRPKLLALSLSPLDVDTLCASVERTGRLVVTHEAPVFGGVGAEVAARVTERCFYSLEAPVLRVAGFDIPFPPARLEKLHLPDADRVLEAVDRAFAF